MSEYGSDNKVIQSDSQRTKEPLSDLRADRTIYVNGRKIESFDFDMISKITIDGRAWSGDYLSAIQYCGTLPRKDRME